LVGVPSDLCFSSLAGCSLMLVIGP
jgi:hypothetical protein